jgi:hypothetical protein
MHGSLAATGALAVTPPPAPSYIKSGNRCLSRGSATRTHVLAAPPGKHGPPHRSCRAGRRLDGARRLPPAVSHHREKGYVRADSGSHQAS